MTEVMTAVGAYEAIYAAITAFINEGDEVGRLSWLICV